MKIDASEAKQGVAEASHGRSLVDVVIVVVIVTGIIFSISTAAVSVDFNAQNRSLMTSPASACCDYACEECIPSMNLQETEVPVCCVLETFQELLLGDSLLNVNPSSPAWTLAGISCRRSIQGSTSMVHINQRGRNVQDTCAP